MHIKNGGGQTMSVQGGMQGEAGIIRIQWEEKLKYNPLRIYDQFAMALIHISEKGSKFSSCIPLRSECKGLDKAKSS